MDETTAPTRAVQAALDALADARVSASLVIVALVAFLAWRLVLRRHRLASAPARPSMPRSFMHRLQSSPAVRALTARFSGRLSAAADAARAARGRTGLHIRWGRTALFLAALVALLVFLVAGLAAAFGAGTLALAGWSLLFAVAGLILSADTFEPAVAEAAIAAGADVVNDTSGLVHADLGRVVAASQAHLVVTHSLAHVHGPRAVAPQPRYDDVVAEVREYLLRTVERAVALGVPEERIIVDPGHDLNKNTLHTLEITRRLDEIAALGLPVLAAVSNKDFIGESLDQHRHERLAGSLAAAVACVHGGARILRMHDAAASVSAARLLECVFGWREPARLVHNMGEANPAPDRTSLAEHRAGRVRAGGTR